MPISRYNWSINCTDQVGNNGASQIRRLHVIRANKFAGNSTDLNQVNMSNISNLVLEQTSYGRINFSEIVDLSDGGDLNTHVNISFNRVFINSSILPALNKSARLGLYNLTFTDPRILKDGEVCPSDVCRIINYNSSR